jgi:hypothetical protein
VPDRVLGDLHQDAIAAGQRLLDAARAAAEPGGVPVDLARVEHGVATRPDVDERGFHARQHVLHAAEIDVADQRVRGRARAVGSTGDECSTSTSSSSTPISTRSPRSRTTIDRSTDSRRARNSASDRIGARRRPASRRPGGAGAWPPAGWSRGRSARRRRRAVAVARSRGARMRDGVGGSSSVGSAASSPEPRRRRRRRRRGCSRRLGVGRRRTPRSRLPTRRPVSDSVSLSFSSVSSPRPGPDRGLDAPGAGGGGRCHRCRPTVVEVVGGVRSAVSSAAMSAQPSAGCPRLRRALDALPRRDAPPRRRSLARSPTAASAARAPGTRRGGRETGASAPRLGCEARSQQRRIGCAESAQGRRPDRSAERSRALPWRRPEAGLRDRRGSPESAARGTAGGR